MLGPRHLKMCELTEKCCIRLQALTFLAPILLLFGYYFVSRCFWVSLSVCSSNLSYLILRYFQPCEHELTSYKGRRVYEFSMGPVLSSNKPDTNAQSVAEIETGGNHFELIHLPSAGGALGVVFTVVLLVFVGYLVVRRCRNKDKALALRAKAGGRREDPEHGFPLGHSPFQQLLVIAAPPMSAPMSPMGYSPWAPPPMLGYNQIQRIRGRPGRRSSHILSP